MAILDTQNEKEWTQNGALRGATEEWDGLGAVAGGFAKEGSGRHRPTCIRMEPECRAYPDTPNQEESR